MSEGRLRSKDHSAIPSRTVNIQNSALIYIISVVQKADADLNDANPYQRGIAEERNQRLKAMQCQREVTLPLLSDALPVEQKHLISC